MMRYFIFAMLAIAGFTSCSSRREELLNSLHVVAGKLSKHENYKMLSNWRKMNLEVSEAGYKPRDSKQLEIAYTHLSFLNNLIQKDSLNPDALASLKTEFQKINEEYTKEAILKIVQAETSAYSTLHQSGLASNQKLLLQKMMLQKIQSEVLIEHYSTVGSCCFCFSRIHPYAVLPALKLKEGEKFTAKIMLILNHPRQRAFFVDNSQPWFSKNVSSLTFVAPEKTGPDTLLLEIANENPFGTITSQTIKYPYQVKKCN